MHDYNTILGVIELRLRSEEHTSELQSHSEISYAVFCLNGTHILKSAVPSF